MGIALRLTACVLCLNAVLFHVAQAQDLPAKTGKEDLEAEAKKLMEELPSLDLPLDVDAPEGAATGQPPEISVEKARASLDRARNKQQRWEKLAKQGVLSRAEAEVCAVEVADALSRLDNARLAQLKAQQSDLEERLKKGEIDRTMVEAGAIALQNAAQSAADTKEQARLTRLNVARTSLDRQKKLFAEGLISRVQLQRAMSVVQKMEAPPVVTAPPAKAEETALGR